MSTHRELSPEPLEGEAERKKWSALHGFLCTEAVLHAAWRDWASKSEYIAAPSCMHVPPAAVFLQWCGPIAAELTGTVQTEGTEDVMMGFLRLQLNYRDVC